MRHPIKSTITLMVCFSVAAWTLSGMVRPGQAGDGVFSTPWLPGDLIVNMNGNEVTGARADINGFETDPNDPNDPNNPGTQSLAVTILTKTSFRSGQVTLQDPASAKSDLFITAPGENSDAGTLYHVARSDGSVTAINSAVNDGTGIFGGGITSDGSFLYLYDGLSNIDRYNFDGTKETDDLITGISTGLGFSKIQQLAYNNGFIFIATSGTTLEVAPAAGGVAAPVTGTTGAEINGVWAKDNLLVTSDSADGEVIAYDLAFGGGNPTASSPVVEGTVTMPSGGFLGGVSVDLVFNKIYAGSAGSFGSEIPGSVLAFDLDSNVEDHNEIDSFLDVVAGLPFGGGVNPIVLPIPTGDGDMDFNGRTDFDDIPAFVSALTDAQGYTSTFRVGPEVKGDTQGDGDFDFDDIPGFVALLTGGQSAAQGVAEPSSLVLLLLAGVGAAIAGRRRIVR